MGRLFEVHMLGYKRPTESKSLTKYMEIGRFLTFFLTTMVSMHINENSFFTVRGGVAQLVRATES